MKRQVKRVFRRLAPLAFLEPEGQAGIAKLGHRGYVGYMWEEIGTLQFEFLVSKGLNPDSYLLDIACGSLRLGVKAIPYLEPSHYLGVEKEKSLIDAALKQELDSSVLAEKHPVLVISDSFEFEKIGHQSDFAIAQSLFTHLPPDLVHSCFNRLYPWLRDDGVFYATYSESDRKVRNPKRPHAHGSFVYTRAEMHEFGELNGFTSRYIGDWGHPRGQTMVEYRKQTTEPRS